MKYSETKKLILANVIFANASDEQLNIIKREEGLDIAELLDIEIESRRGMRDKNDMDLDPEHTAIKYGKTKK